MSLHRLVPIVLVALMFAGEAYAGRLKRAEVQSRDRGSVVAVYLLMGGGFGLAFTLWNRRPPPGPVLGDWALWAGAAVTLVGIALRLWSVATLGQYFTYVVKVTPDQKVVDTGPYRLIRHPSYTGGLLTVIGIGLSMGYALGPVVVGVSSLIAYLIRIRVEEQALAQGIGAPYRAYMARTKRLIPFVW